MTGTLRGRPDRGGRRAAPDIIGRSRWISDWDPEDAAAWRADGARIARRNLAWSMVAHHVSFSVWSMWSVLVLFMPASSYHIDAAGKFYLIATATLVGGCARIPYTVAVARFGGRNWTVCSALILLIPTALTLYFVQHPETPYRTFVLVAALTGFAGGHFASSMTNINAFFPRQHKGLALGLDAWGGNVGVTGVQLVGLAVLATVGLAPVLVCGIYLVLSGIAAVCCALFMDNLAVQRTNLKSMARALRHPESWLVCFLYVCSFGSFIGFAFAFGQMLQINYLAAGQSAPNAALHAAQIAFAGPLLGSCTRPIGGVLADRFGGAAVTAVTFAAMTVAAGALVALIEASHHPGGVVEGGILPFYVSAFMVLFALSGLGNGAVFRMIPALFDRKAQRLRDPEARTAWAREMSGALIGLAGACGALGGVFINLALRASYQDSARTAAGAFLIFLVSYAVCVAITLSVFQRGESTAMRSAIVAGTGERTGAR